MTDGYGGEDEAEELHRRRGCRSGRGRRPRTCVNPATGEAIAAAPLSTKPDVDAAVAAAKDAFPGWAATPPGERARALLRMADLIEERGEEIADLEAADAGKPRSAVVEDEIPVMADKLRFFAGAARTMEGRAAGEYMEGHTSFIRREPIGVVGQITPWNYPLMMAIWKIGPALASRQHGGAEAGRDDAADHAALRRVVRRDPAGRASSTRSAATASRPAPSWSPTPTSAWSA